MKAPAEKHDSIRAQLGGSKNLKDFADWLKAENLQFKAAQGAKPAEQLPLQMLPQLTKLPVGQARVMNAPDGLTVVVVAVFLIANYGYAAFPVEIFFQTMEKAQAQQLTQEDINEKYAAVLSSVASGNVQNIATPPINYCTAAALVCVIMASLSQDYPLLYFLIIIPATLEMLDVCLF